MDRFVYLGELGLSRVRSKEVTVVTNGWHGRDAFCNGRCGRVTSEIEVWHEHDLCHGQKHYWPRV